MAGQDRGGGGIGAMRQKGWFERELEDRGKVLQFVQCCEFDSRYC